ncbi:MAG: T9SS type A sorting domain-containing protein, partial [Bacteroidia bacterium]
YHGTGPELYCNAVNFTNNLTALKTGNQGSNFFVAQSRFMNNEVGILGNYSAIDSITPYRQLQIRSTTFERNRTAIKSAYCSIESCQFVSNETAVEDGLYSSIDSSGFNDNTLALSGYGLKIERCIFFLNDKAIIHTGRNPMRDKMLRNSIIRSNNFESNKEGVYLEDGAMIGEISCNLFTKNDFALVLPDSLYNSQKAPYRVERNIFIQNDLAIKVLELESSTSPAPGSNVQPVNFLYNMMALNFVILDHTSPYNLNFFHNYILGPDPFFIELRLVDGYDKPGEVGLVNYTVSGDTTLVNDFITVNKIQDVIKHLNYDSALISGNTYSFEMCASMPGNVLGIEPADESIHVLVYPNPFTQILRVEWEEGSQFDFLLYNLTGQEIPLQNAEGLSSPAQFDLGPLEAGIYLLRVNSGSEVRSFKLIKR